MNLQEIYQSLHSFREKLSKHLKKIEKDKETVSLWEVLELLHISAKKCEETETYLKYALKDTDKSFKEVSSIAERSLKSFETSNTNIKSITSVSKDILLSITADETNRPYIDKIAHHFGHLEKELLKANEEIKTLGSSLKVLEKQTVYDPLTKLYNRHALQNYMKSLLAKQVHKDLIFGILLEVNDIPAINKKYGTGAGDKILIYVATILRKVITHQDRAFRKGGIQFFIALNNKEVSDCRAMAKSMIYEIETRPLKFKNYDITLSSNLGLTQYRQGDDTGAFFHRLDIALNKSKENGKNVIAIY